MLKNRLYTGKMSPIIEDDGKFYIIRVIEREDGGRIPFREAQVEIRDRIREDRKLKKAEQYMNRLKEDIKVWTVFDDIVKKAEELQKQEEMKRKRGL